MEHPLQEIRESGLADRVQILSFDWRTLQQVQRLSLGTRSTPPLPLLLKTVITIGLGSHGTSEPGRAEEVTETLLRNPRPSARTSAPA